MYSRTPDVPPRAVGEPSYRRAPSVLVPPNYSGNAFPAFAQGDAGGEPPTRKPLTLSGPPAPADAPQPDFRDLPQVSRLPRRDVDPAPPPALPDAPRSENTPPGPPEPRPVPEQSPAPSRPVPLRGLGQEEIVILGLCLLLLHEDTDESGGHGGGNDLWETLLLLGALLFF